MSQRQAGMLDADPAAAPLYCAVRDDLLDRIREGVYPVGTRLPGRKELADEYGVAYGTVDRAVRGLESMDVVRVRNGVGSFVVAVPEGGPATGGADGSGPSPAQRAAPRRVSPVVGQSGGGVLTQPATLGVIASSHPSIPNNWHRVVVQTVERAFSAAGGATRLFDRFPAGSGRPRPLVQVLDQALAAEADGLLVVGLHYPLRDAEAVIRRLREVDTCATYVAWRSLPPGLPHVYYNNVVAGHEAATHLLRAGYRRLAFLCLQDAEWERGRLEGVRRAVQSLGSEETRVEVLSGDVPEVAGPDELRMAGRRMAQRFLDSRSEPVEDGVTALVASSDASAAGVLDCLQEAGLASGRQVGVVGFDDTPQAQALGLSSVRPPLEDLARNAVQMVVARLNGERAPLSVCCQSDVIVRASSFRG